MSIAIGTENQKSILRKPETPAKETKTVEAKKTTAAKTTKK